MIVPQSRILWWVGLVLVPAAILGAVFPPVAGITALLVVGIVAWALLDAAFSAQLLQSVQVRVPPVIRLFKEREGVIELEIVNPAKEPFPLRVGLALPWEMGSLDEDLLVRLPAESEISRVTWKCQPRQRGWFQLTACYLERPSRFGFWAMRAAREVKTELRVYPDLLTERRQVAALFLNRGRLGVHARRQVGKGRDFEKLREYVPGDSYDEIHWKATAKRGTPVTKVFQVERTQEVYVVIDASRLAARKASRKSLVTAQDGAGEEEDLGNVTVLERFITSALLLGVAAEQQGDLFGLVTFSDHPKKFLRARSGTAHYDACREALYTLEPETVSPDFDELAAFLRVRLRRRALLVILTALDDPVIAEGFVRSMDLLSRQHLILVNMIPPYSVRPLFTNDAVNSMDDIYRELGGHLQWQKLRELDQVLRRRGVSLSLLDRERMSAQLISQYLEVKQRQLL